MIRNVITFVFVLFYVSFLILKNVFVLLTMLLRVVLDYFCAREDISSQTHPDEANESNISGDRNPGFQLILKAKISPPKCFEHISPMKESEMKSFWESLDNSFGRNENIDKDRMIKDRMFESLYYCVTNERVDIRKIRVKISQMNVKRFQCEAFTDSNSKETIVAYYSLIPLFLLLDSPKEAYRSMQLTNEFGVGKLLRYNHPFYNYIPLLRNGRQKKIAGWELKVLAAYIKTFQQWFPSIPHNVNIRRKQNYSKQNPEIDMMVKFEMICFYMKDRVDHFLSPLRCKAVEVAGISHPSKLLDQLSVKFYGAPINEISTSGIFNRLTHPLALILKCMDDGLIKETTNKEYIEELFRIDPVFHNYISTKDNTRSIDEQGRLVQRGECLIINQVFKDNPQYYRQGTEQDEESLIRTWNMIGCKGKITIVRDLTKKQIIIALNKFRQKLETTRPDFMVIFILSHGFRDKRTGCDCIMDINQQGLTVTSIKNKFIDGHLCPSMVGKPKLFFIQACRGKFRQEYLSNNPSHLFIPAVDFSETDGEEDEEKMLEIDGVKYAHKSWFFVFHSTIKDFVSLRCRSGGTLFIQTLCKVLNESWYVNDISTIAMEVNRRIMKDYRSAQAPIFENQLGNPVFFDATNSNIS